MCCIYEREIKIDMVNRWTNMDDYVYKLRI